MRKLIALSAIAVLAITTPALAFQCPKLVKTINDTAGNRFDSPAQNARIAADKAAKLHAFRGRTAYLREVRRLQLEYGVEFRRVWGSS